MAITVLGARRRLHRVGLGDCLPEERFEQLLRDRGHKWRERLLTPLVFLRLFVLQMLHANIAINALRQKSGIDFSDAAYVKARQRAPLWSLSQLLREMVLGAVADDARWRKGQKPDLPGGRVYVIDGSSVSVPDTPALHKRFGLPSNQVPGVGYPQASILGVMDLLTGLMVRLVVRSVFTHDLRGAVRIHAALKAGDILLADRAFASFGHLALLAERGIDCVFRLGASCRSPDGIVRWNKSGRKAPPWIDASYYRKLRKFIKVRIITYRIKQPGFRTKSVRLVTTLLDEKRWSDRQLCDLYAKRWQIETAFGHAKTTMKMGTPKCKTCDGVMKELAVSLIVYNLIRLQMLKWARQEGVDATGVSFVDAMRYLTAKAMGLDGVHHPILHPTRRSRRQLRMIRRRPKHYTFLTKPRAQTNINHDPRRR